MKNITKNLQIFIYKTLLLTGLFFATQTQAEAEKTIIVFDASGSMWGQIDGKSKIEIAREAFANLKSDWQADNGGIGLIAYGHNRKGDCSDIEMLVNPAVGDIGSVSDAISSLRPKGKTPLSDAVKMAAQKLKYQEEKATVILFSDGIETCSADPCALSNDLAADGIDFTAHVIGFGLSKDADKEQLRCIAENTGGKYFDANNAQDLNDALDGVTSSIPVVIEEKSIKTAKTSLHIRMNKGSVRPHKMKYVATNLDSDERINFPPLEGTKEVLTGIKTELPYGEWKIEIISKEGYGSTNVTVGKKTRNILVTFGNNEMKFELADNGPYQLGLEHQFYLNALKNLPSNLQLTVALLPADSMNFKEKIDWETRFGKDPIGVTQHGFVSPKVAGDYEIILIKGYDLSKAIARFPITYVNHIEAKWNGVLEGAVGGKLPVEISGIVQRNGSLTIVNAAGEVSKYKIDELDSKDGVFLPMPGVAGQYDLIYGYKDEKNVRQSLNLGKLTVGDIILQDDADSVDAPDIMPSSTKEVTEVAIPTSTAHKLNMMGHWQLVHSVTGEEISRMEISAAEQVGDRFNLDDIDTNPNPSSKLMGDSEKLKLNILAIENGRIKIQFMTEFGNVASLMEVNQQGVFNGIMVAATGGVFLPVKLQKLADVGLSADEHGWEPRNTPSNIDKVLKLNYDDNKYIKRCQAAKCSYSNDKLEISDMPLIGDFSLLQAFYLKSGELHLMLVNEVNGEFVELNPLRITDAVYDCVRVGMLGHHGQDPETATDSVCMVKKANIDTINMHEILEFWVVERSVAIMEKLRKDHEDSMGGEEGLITAIGDLSALPTDRFSTAYECLGIKPCAVLDEKHNLNWHIMPNWESTYPTVILLADGSKSSKFNFQMRNYYDGSEFLITYNPIKKWDGICLEVTAGQLCRPSTMTTAQEDDFKMILSSFKDMPTGKPLSQQEIDHIIAKYKGDK